MGIRQRLLDTPADRVTPELAKTVGEFCAPLEAIRSAYVGLIEITHDFGYPEVQLGVAFELAAPAAETPEGDRQLRLVADRFYDTLPEEIQAGGCNFLEPGGITVWHEKARQVFSRPGAASP